MKTQILGFLALWSVSLTSFASKDPLFSGAREAGMAHSALSLGGSWAVYHNPAGIATDLGGSLSFCHTNNYLIRELARHAMAGVAPVSRGAIGLGYTYSGTPEYNEQLMVLAYAHKLSDKLEAGISFDAHSVWLPADYGHDFALTGSLGMLARPVKQLTVGLQLYNLTNAHYQKYNFEAPASFFRGGITWQSGPLLAATSIMIQKNGNTELGLGTEFQAARNLDVRLGVSSSEAMSLTFGVGYSNARWSADLAFMRHPLLGFSSMFSLDIRIGKIPQ